MSLFVRHGRGAFQFNYNPQVKEAIKELIKGRQWDPKDKKLWTFPLESLPDAVRLFEHMGRKPDADVKQRAEQLLASGAADDTIKLTVRLRRLDHAAAAAELDAGAVGRRPPTSPTTATWWRR